MIGPVRRRIAFWLGVVVLSWSALLWLIIVGIALDDPEDLGDLMVAASVMTGAGLWTLLVGRGILLAGNTGRRRGKPRVRSASNRLPTAESALIEDEKRRIQEELVAYDLVIESHEAATVSTSVLELAAALVGKGRTLARSDRPTEALSVYETVLARFGESTEPEQEPMLAAALAGKAVALGELGREEESLYVAEETVTRFGNRLEPEFDESVARALGAKGLSLLGLARLDEGFEALDLVLARYGDATNPDLLKQVAGALQAKAGALGERGRVDEAISVLDEIVSRFRKASDADLRLAAAWALGAKGAGRGEQGRSSEALAAYDNSIALVGVETDLESLTIAGMAQVRRPLALAEMERWDEAIIGFNEVIQRFDGLGEPGLDLLVAQALFGKGATLAEMGRWRKAVATWGELIDRFGDTRDPEVFEAVVRAMISRAGVLLEVRRWKKAMDLSAETSERILKDKNDELLEAVPFASGFREWVSQSLDEVRQFRGEAGIHLDYLLFARFEEFTRQIPGYGGSDLDAIQTLDSERPPETLARRQQPAISKPRVEGRHLKPDEPGWEAGSSDETPPRHMTPARRPTRSLERLSGKALRLFESGKDEESRKLYERLVAESIKMWGPDHEQTLLARASLANTYGSTPERGAVLLEEVLEDMTRILGSGDARLFLVWADLAGMYGNSGDHAKANELGKRLVEDVERALGRDDPLAQAARDTVFVSGLELSRAAAQTIHVELSPLLEFSSEDLPQRTAPAGWEESLRLAIAHFEDSPSHRSERIGRFLGPEVATIEWRLGYLRPDRFHVIQTAWEGSNDVADYDEWITIERVHYQNTGVWLKEVSGDQFRHERELNPLLRGDGYVQLAGSMQPEAALVVDSGEGEYLVLSYPSLPPDLVGLTEATVADGRTELWIALDRKVLARADSEATAFEGGTEFRLMVTHGFTSYGEDISITEPPEGSFIDLRNQT